MKLNFPLFKSFKPGKNGVHQVLGDLEGDIMEVLWEHYEGISGRQVYQALLGKRKLAYTTALTVLERLANKGLVKKEKNNDSTYIYRTAVKKKEFLNEVSNSVMKGLMELSGKGAVAAFVNALDKMEPSAIQELERLLSKRKDAQNGL